MILNKNLISIRIPRGNSMSSILLWFNFNAMSTFRRYPKVVGTDDLKVQTNLREFWDYGRPFYETV